MKNILVPTDFSDNAKAALEYAMHLAFDWKAGITLVHTFIPPVVPANTPQEVYHSIIATEEEQASASLLQQISWLRGLGSSKFDSINIKPLLLNKSFVPGILETARQHNSNLIVMGTKGASGLKRILMGSNTVDLIQRTSFPVLAIPENTKFTAPKTIVLAMDIKQTRYNNRLPFLNELAGIYHARVLIFYAKQNEADLSALHHKAQQHIEASLPHVHTYWHSTESREVEKSIVVFVNDSKADMLVMLPRKKGWWEHIFKNSYTYNIAFNPVIPLLILPED